MFTEFVVILLVTVHTEGGSKELIHVVGSNSSEEDACSSPWFIHNSTSPGHTCQCGSELGGMVRCNDQEHSKEISIMNCNCMTVDDQYGVLAGSCFVNCLNKLYYKLPLNISEMN